MVEFHPERGVSSEPAKAVCAGCLVRAECLAYASLTCRSRAYGAAPARRNDSGSGEVLRVELADDHARQTIRCKLTKRSSNYSVGRRGPRSGCCG